MMMMVMMSEGARAETRVDAGDGGVQGSSTSPLSCYHGTAHGGEDSSYSAVPIREYPGRCDVARIGAEQ